MTTETETRTKLALEIENGLAHCSGGDEVYSHWTRRLKYTEGVQYLADKAGAFWLIDVVASYQGAQKVRQNERLQEFQLWELKVTHRVDDAGVVRHEGVVTCREDSDQPAVITQKIEYTDFPLESIKLYVENGVLLLPSEH